MATFTIWDIMNQLSQMVKVAIPHFLVSKMEGWLGMFAPNTSGATMTQTLCFNLRKVAGDNQITVTTSTNAEFRVHKSRGSFKYPTKNFVYGPTITTFIMRDVKATAEEFEAMSKDVMASAQGNSMAVEDQGKKILSVRTKDGKPARCNPAFCDFKIVHCVHPYCRSASRRNPVCSGSKSLHAHLFHASLHTYNMSTDLTHHHTPKPSF